mgnify:CR=1 FL=1
MPDFRAGDEGPEAFDHAETGAKNGNQSNFFMQRLAVGHCQGCLNVNGFSWQIGHDFISQQPGDLFY